MEYFRFIAAIVPLLNLLVFLMLANLGVKIFPRFISSWVLIFLGSLSLTQIGRVSDYPPGNCSQSISLNIGIFSLKSLSESVLKNNCAISRDLNGVKPFIDNILPELLNDNGGKLTIASYQAGFFPFHLRQSFRHEEVYFIDSMGLTELDVARIPGVKSVYGIISGQRIDLILQNKAGSLSEYFARRSINLVYLLTATSEERLNYKDLGYETVWDVDGSVVFYRPDDREKTNPSQNIMPFIGDVQLGDQFGILKSQGHATLFIHPGATTPTSFNFAAADYLRDGEKATINIHARIAPNIPDDAVKRGAGNVLIRLLQGEKKLIEEVVSVGHSLKLNLPIVGNQPLRFIVDNNGGADTDWLMLSIH